MLNAPTPALLAIIANALPTLEVIPNWSDMKYRRMREVFHAKFIQHDDLRQLLLSTVNRRTVWLQRLYVLFFVELGSRRVHLARC
jgi:predicted NAD-dependent protein-ADP-ribosyltransferase YbiA (DUF1768 family)